MTIGRMQRFGDIGGKLRFIHGSAADTDNTRTNGQVVAGKKIIEGGDELDLEEIGSDAKDNKGKAGRHILEFSM